MWMDKLERKIGRFSIPHLMRYIIFANVAVYLISMFQPYITLNLVLDRNAVLAGQVWRLISFVFIPPSSGNVFMTALSLYCYYWIGNALEASWGTFRFNLFYLIGMLATIFVSMVFGVPGVPTYMNQVLFLALASLYPNHRVLMFYFLPLKSMWAGIISAAFMLYDFVVAGSVFPAIRYLIGAALINYLIFFAPILVRNIKYRKRRKDYEKMTRPQGFGAGMQWQTAKPKAAAEKQDSDRGKIIKGVPFHKCHVCGITDVDDPDMTFRYCSQCNGNYEYCEDHLHNHEHVK